MITFMYHFVAPMYVAVIVIAILYVYVSVYKDRNKKIK